ncbi:MAG: hypothetical protein ACI4Q9_00355 [Candidatus Methanomethylophilaceae archaeon]
MRSKEQTFIIAVTLILAAVMIAGEWFAYYAPHDRTSSASLDGDTVSYSITSDGNREYKAVLLDNGTYDEVVELYLYYDEGYASNVCEDNSPPIGSPQFTQKYYIEQIQNYVSYKGMHAVSRASASELLAVMTEQISDDSCRGKGVLFASGSIPSVLFDGSSSSVLRTWMTMGGTVYWIGNELGKYVSNGDELTEVNGSEALTGVPGLTFLSGGSSTESGELRTELSLASFDLSYAVSGTGVRHFGYVDGGFSSIGCIAVGAGQVCVISGNFTMNQTKDVSNTVCAGVSYWSQLAGYDEGTFTKKVEGTMTVRPTHGNLSMYLYVGAYHSVYGERYDL